MKFKSKLYIGALFAAITLSSCEKLIEIDDPINELPSEVIFKSETTAKSALAGAYSSMTSSSAFNQNITQFNGMSAGEIDFVGSTTFQDFMQNTYDPVVTTRINNVWADTYNVIYRFNSIIDGLLNNNAISAPVAQQMIGEARVMRAFCYFHLVNMFGEVPLVTITDVNKTSTLPRVAVPEIYNWLASELEEAKDLVSDTYPGTVGTTSRAQVNRSAAKALLARVYLFQKNYQKAEQYATEVINKTDLYTLLPKSDLGKVFLKDSKEAILQLGPAVMNTNGYTVEGSTFLPTPTSTVANYELTQNLLAAFESNDARRAAWIKESNYLGKRTFQPFKYQNYNQTVALSSGRTEVPMLLRLSEQYLIRAEARSQLNNSTGAREDLNVIRHRAGLQDLSSNINLDEAILKERQTEYFCELGDRWYSIKRMGKVDVIMQELRPSFWKSYAQLYPIPQPARDTNPFLTQNDGYR
ncbi:RagB/SusD family nutrient uptake outer membrane protein [Sphingobacterium sp. InxBP1]|uniref:RagB/SusD family nutrient uptake outer membrane protein n=1 Tax=Sphingobacterium sp. InxBP1 TaxID=2870328 RepID=UPI002243F68E|nr:RagB/SusD family nutrient uptake outer membrane protein [Sphingobacterium sp. InxBP1]MCW8313857.1 RagB/SusD family nutrient uptake outer membrane protein [Sphingobacterium sp. InxBP1]